MATKEVVTTETIELIKNHRSIRSFTEEKIETHVLEALVEAAQFASTSNFVQAYSIVTVIDENNRKQIADLAGPQKWIEKAPVFLVFCADLKRPEEACQYENVDMDKGMAELLLVSTVDASLLAQNVMLAAESLGLGGVFIGGIRNDPAKVSELLKLPVGVYPVFGMCLGHPKRAPEQKPRMPVSMVLKTDTYSSNEADLMKYNKTCEEYYSSRSQGSRIDTWTHQIANMLKSKLRPHMKDFLAKQGFNLK